MRLKTIAIAAAAVVVVVIIAAVAIVSSMDFNQYRGVIAERVKAATGRELSIKGDLKLALGLSPAIAVNDVTFANAPWGSRPVMAQVRRFEAQIALLPLLFGNIDIKRLVLLDADVLLETDRQGHGNWAFVAAAAQEASKPTTQPAPEKAGGTTRLPAISEVDVRNARLTYRDGKTGETTTLALQRAKLGASSPSAPMKLDIGGTVNDLAFQVAGQVGSVQAMSSPGTPFPVNISGNVADAARFKVDGTIREPLAAKGYELTISAEGAEIALLAKIAGVQLTPVGPFKVDAKVTDGAPGGNPSVPLLKAELGKPQLVLVRAEGAVRDPLAKKGIEMKVTAEGQEIGAFSGFGAPGLAGPLPPIPALGPFHATLQVTNGPGDRPSVPQLKLDVGRSDLLEAKIEGAIQDPLAAKGFNLAVAAQSPDLRAVAAKAGTQAPISGPLTLAAKIADAGPNRYAMSGLNLKAGNSDLNGEAMLATGGTRPVITANLSSTQVDLAAFMAPQDKKAAPTGGTGGGSSGAKDNRVFSDDPLPFDVLDKADGDVRYNAAKVLAKGTAIGNLAMAAAWKNGEFNLRPLSADIGGGKVNVELGANARTQTVAGKVDVKGVELGPLLQQMQTTDVLHQGKTDFAVDFRGAGKSMHALMAALNGVSALHVGEGELESKYIDLLGADVVRVLSPLKSGHAQTKLNCVVGRYEIKDGVVTPKVMLADTGRMTVVGEGTVNLGTEQLALTFTPRAKDAALVSLAIPIRVGGTLASPSFSPDTGAALKGAAGAAAGALILGPAGALVPLISGGDSGKDPCAQALAQAGLRGGAPAPTQGAGAQKGTAQPQQQQPKQPANPAEDVGRGLRRLFGQ